MPDSKWGGKRPGAGRPKGSGDFPEQLTIRLTEEQYRHVMGQNVSAAEYLRQLIEADLDAYRERRRPPGRPPKE